MTKYEFSYSYNKNTQLPPPPASVSVSVWEMQVIHSPGESLIGYSNPIRWTQARGLDLVNLSKLKHLHKLCN